LLLLHVTFLLQAFAGEIVIVNGCVPPIVVNVVEVGLTVIPVTGTFAFTTILTAFDAAVVAVRQALPPVIVMTHRTVSLSASVLLV
jgi:hypothetical protein